MELRLRGLFGEVASLQLRGLELCLKAPEVLMTPLGDTGRQGTHTHGGHGEMDVGTSGLITDTHPCQPLPHLLPLTLILTRLPCFVSSLPGRVPGFLPELPHTL